MSHPTCSDFRRALELHECPVCLMDSCTNGFEIDLLIAVFVTSCGDTTMGEMLKNMCEEHRADYERERRIAL